MPGNFIDTNMLIYLASGNPEKANRVEEIVGGGGCISVQVLNELANIAAAKMRMSWPELRVLTATIRDLLSVHAVTAEVHETGLALAERYTLSIYDAMIVSAALHAECVTLWSEDMHHGMVIDNRLRIINPFRVAP